MTARVEAICTNLLNTAARPAFCIEPRSVPKDWGVYLWKCVRSGEVVYIGSAVGQWGLYQRIVQNHLCAGYWKKQKGEEQSVFRKAVAVDADLRPGAECVDYIKQNFCIAWLVCPEDSKETIKDAEGRLIAKLRPKYNNRGT